MNLRVGVLGESMAWRQILAQEGVGCGIVDVSRLDASQWSVVIVAHPMTGIERSAVRRYLEDGGAVLAFAGYMVGVCEIRCRNVWIEYLLPDGDDEAFDIHILDLRLEGAVPQGANILRTDRNEHAGFAGPLGGGHACLLPFDPALVLHDTRVMTKNFYAKPERLPAEQVSLVSKGDVMHLVRKALRFLHYRRALPYFHLWYYPNGSKSAFAFRVDTDGARREDVERMYQIASQHESPVSWFIDVQRCEPWLQRFREFRNHEIAVHCYRHKMFVEYNDVLSDVSTAAVRLKAVGLNPLGFAAPYGIWTPSVNRVADELGFVYTSEFSWAYDSFPLPVQTAEVRRQILQIPIHPVCTGSMLRVGYTARQMSDYFAGVVSWKLARGDSLVFYHHPGHRCWEVVERIFADAEGADILKTTFHDFALWWKLRESIDYEAMSGDGSVRVVLPAGSEGRSDVWFEVIAPGGRSLRGRLSPGTIDLSKHEMQPSGRQPVPSDLSRAREFDSRAKLAEWYNSLLRRFG